MKRTRKTNKHFEVPDECSVCLQSYIQPCRLTCGHVFCFLCIKGFISQKLECAMCRSQVKSNYLDKPELVDLVTNKAEENKALNSQAGKSEEYFWFYKGQNGWWKYDERTSMEIEREYDKKTQQFQLLIAGSLYTIDLASNMQIRVDNPSRKREIKRDCENFQTKGTAGILESHINKAKRKKT